MEEGFQNTVLYLHLCGSSFESRPDAGHMNMNKKLQTIRDNLQ